MLTATEPVASGFDADHADIVIAIEADKEPDRVAAAADARDDGIGSAAVSLDVLSAGFFAL